MKSSYMKKDWFKKLKNLYVLSLLMLSLSGIAQNVSVSGAVSGNGSYPDLNSAFAAINGGVQTSANITVSILASTNETTTAVLNQGAWNILFISPSGGSYTITGDLAAPIIDLNGADLVTINGLNSGGNALTIANTNTLNTNTSTIRLINDANLNNIINCTVLGSSRSAALGTITFSTAASTGNSNNNIINCNIGPAGANLPNNGIFSLGTATFDNKNNNITNCNIYDYFTPDLASSGIFLSTNNTNWSVSGNRFYQTALRTYTVGNTIKAIQINSGNSYTVSNNIIGYSSSAATGTTSMAGTIATRFVGIDMSVGTATASSVQGNTVSAITLSTSSGAATVNGIICGINILTGNVNVGTTSGNIIGGTSGTNLINGYPTTTQGMIVGINSSSTGTINIANNYIGGLFSSGTTAAVAGGVSGINISGVSPLLSVVNNTIGNPTANNMQAGTLGLTTGNSLLYGIFISSSPTGTANFSNNVIRNGASFGTGVSGVSRGIYTGSTGGTGTYSVTNNTILNLTTNNGNTAQGNGQLGNVGIAITNGVSNIISRNTIGNLANTNTLTTAVNQGGISTAVSSNPTISNNIIYGLSNTGASTSTTAPSQVYGIFVRGGSGTLTVNNNMISLGTGQTANTAYSGVVLYGGGGTVGLRMYYNTINITGTVTTGNQSSFCFYRGGYSAFATTWAVDLKNNLFTNTRTGGTGVHCTIANNYASTANNTGWGVNASNYNILNTSTSTAVAWYNGPVSLAAWQSTISCDANSYTGASVNFVNPANDLHLNMGTTPNLMESSATPLVGYTTDIDGQNRPGPSGSVNGGGLTPDIGADEFDGVILDILAPTITHTFIGTSCSTGDRTLTANINDASGVSTSGTLVPRVYFNKNAGSYFSNPGVLASGNASVGVWNFTISASALGGLSNNDVVSYFITAQDLASTVNIGALPSAGFVAVDVNSVTSTPTVPYTYTVSGISAGSISVASFTTCAGQTVAINSGSSTIGSDVSRYWQVSSTSGGPYSNLLSGTGLTSTAVTTGSLSSGTLYFVLSATCLTSNQSTVSNEATVAVNPTPSSSISVNTQSVCLGTDLIFAGSTDVGTSFNWSGPGSFVSTSQNPTITTIGYSGSGTYSLYTNLGTCNSATTTIGVTVMGTVNIISPAVSTSASICNGGTSQLSVSAVPTIPSVNLYKFNNGTGASLINTASGTTVLTTSNDDTPMASPSNIGFTFNFNGTNYTQFSASPDGWIVLGAATGTAQFSNSVTGAINLPLIYPYWDDVATGTTGFVRTLVTGTAPFRIFVVEWFVTIPRNTTGAANSSFQLLLYETTNEIEFRYGNMNTATMSSSSGLTASAALFNCITFTNNTNSSTVANNANSTQPANGTYYIFSPGTIGYSWSPSLGLSSSTLASITSSASASTVYTVTMTNSGFCPITNTVSLAVVNPVTLSVSSSTNIVCSGSSATITASGANTYLWDNSSTSNSIVVNPSSNTTYTVIGGATLPCPDVTETITINSGITPTLSVSGTSSICAGDNATITASGANTYTWDNGSPSSSIITSPSVTVTYTISGSDLQGCTSNSTYVLSVNQLPTVNISGSNTICDGQTLNLTASGANSYLWSTSDVTSTIATTPSANITYSVIGTSAAGCTNTSSQAITVNPTPTLSVVANATVCQSQSVSLVAAGAITYTWNTGSNSSSIVANPTANTTYTVNGSNSFGCSSSTTQLISTLTSPTISISGANTLCIGQTLTLTANGANTYTWNSGSNLATINDSPVSNTSYTVIGTNGIGCTDEEVITTTVYSLPSLTVAGTASICAGQTVSLNVSGANTYSWSTGSSANNISTTPSVSQTYTVTGTDLLGCSSTNTRAVVVAPLPTINIAGSSGICTGQTATLIASGANTYTWNTSSNSATITDTPVSNTSYTVTGTDLLGCVNTSTQQVTVAASLTISIVGPSSICIGQQANLTGNGGVTYTWNTGATTQTIAPNPTVTTTYSIIGASGTCSNTGVTTVSVNPIPVVSISGAAPTCLNQTITLTASGASTYTWDSGATTSTIQSSSGMYTVVGTNAFGCTAVQTVVVVGLPVPNIGVAQSAASVCVNSPATFTASGADTYTWSTASNNTIITITPTTAAVYSVAGTNSFGCISSNTVALGSYSLPILSTSPASATVCAFSPVSFTANGANTYTWNNTVINTSATFTPSSASVYTLAGVNSDGCVSTITVAVSTNTLPALVISPASATVCANSTASFTAGGASTYTWNGSINSSTAAFSPSISSVYTLSGTNPAGCVNSTTLGVSTNTLPIINVAQSTNTICVNSTATFTASGANTYTWSNALNGATIGITPTTAATYTVVGTNGFGCVSSRTFALATFSLPVLTIVPASATVCSLSQATFNASGANTYTWNGSILTQTASFTPTTSSIYTLSGTNGSGCVSTVTLGVSTNTLPILTITPANATVCASTNASFTASGASTYTWSGSVVSSSAVFAPSITTVYTVTGVNPAGCRTTTSLSVNTLTLPVITIAPASASVCAFSTSSYVPSGAVTYTWTNTSTNTLVATTGTAAITPSAAAIYTVTGTNGSGCVSSKSLAVGVYALPVLTITPASPTVCSLSQVSFTASGASTYTWNSSINTATAAFSPSSNATYTLVGTSVNSCVSTTTVGVITNSLPVITVASSTNIVCAFSPATFTASGANTYTWSNTLTGNTTTVYPNTNTTYTVIGTDALGCTSSETVAISTNSLPIIVVSPSLTTICALQNTTLSVSGANTYSWSNGSTNSTSVVNPSVTSSFSVIGTDALGCSNVANAIVITNTLPIITITADNSTVCANSIVNFTANGGTTYTWSTGSNATTISVTPSITTTYSVNGTDPNNGCVSSGSIAINTLSLPIITVASSAQSVCIGSSATFTANGAQTYTWTQGGFGNTYTATPSSATVYLVSGTDGLGCSSTSSVSLGIYNLPVVTVSPGNQTVCITEVASFTAGGASTYTWMPGNIVSSNYTVAPTTISFYTVMGTDANGCVNDTTFLITVSQCVGISEKNQSASLINVFPNPSRGIVTAEFDFEGVKEINVVNAIGELVLGIKTENHSETFDLSSYAKGIYYIRIRSNNVSSNYRIIIE